MYKKVEVNPSEEVSASCFVRIYIMTSWCQRYSFKMGSVFTVHSPDTHPQELYLRGLVRNRTLLASWGLIRKWMLYWLCWNHCKYKDFFLVSWWMTWSAEQSNWPRTASLFMWFVCSAILSHSPWTKKKSHSLLKKIILFSNIGKYFGIVDCSCGRKLTGFIEWPGAYCFYPVCLSVCLSDYYLFVCRQL